MAQCICSTSNLSVPIRMVENDILGIEMVVGRSERGPLSPPWCH